MEPLEPQSWHHGLVARWWSLFRRSGPEIAYFRQFVEAGQPALDVACGAGRLLVPYVEAGLDVDGCDASADMVSLCAQAAAAVGATPNLYCQPMHELDLPRRYRTIYVCGGLGLGSTRAQDEQALRRLHEHLEPGGRLVLDNEVPYADPSGWARWPPGTRQGLPAPDEPPAERQLGPDGDEYALVSRMLSLDPLEQQESWEIHAYRWRDGSLVDEERHRLTTNLYFRAELVMMLQRAGFGDVEVQGGYDGLPPTADDTFLVFTATRA
ncbi:class I SAM-dependent methyltransferase [Ornithinimicrobium sp. W1679]|uniref:class I SAM-dependent methyltransferase n=1 Tax=Ornithinimicrobium sp. W1679 TaxID=3418770 RepID=UPI003CE8F8DD